MENAVAKIEPQAVVPADQGSVALMRLIERATMDASFDVAKLEQLLAVKERWEANEARKAFVVAKAAFAAEAPIIVKNKHVGFDSRRGGDRTDYHHATLDNVADTLLPILSKHGLAYSWETEQKDAGIIRVTCVLTHVMGHSERVSLQAGPDQSGNKNSIQAVGSTVTYLQRYTLLAVTGVATGDMDDDGDTGGASPLTEEQLVQLRAELDEAQADIPAFCRYMGVESLQDIQQAQLGMARTAIAAKKGKAK